MKKSKETPITSVKIGKQLKYLCQGNNRQKKVYPIDKRDFADLIHDMYEGEYKVFDYPADSSAADKAYSRTKTQKTIANHIDDKQGVSFNWINIYCKFFGCSSDFLLGLIDMPTHEITDINKASGLSSAAIQKLLDNPEVKIVTDNLLRTNAIDYFIQALSVSVQIKHMDNFIASQIEKKKIPGVTKNDLDMFRSNLDSGNRSQIENFAIVCFDNLLNKNLNDYFDDKATKRYLDNLDSDLKSK